MVTKLDENRARKWMWRVLAALAAVQLYFVRELLAALALFAVAFIVLGLTGLLLYLMHGAGQRGLVWAERSSQLVAGRFRQVAAVVRAAPISRSSIRRLRSLTAR